MRPYDELTGKRIFKRDQRLVRQDLEAWARTGSAGQGISDEKFRFIHDFIIEILLTGNHPYIEEFIVRHRSEAHCRSIAEVYQNHRFDKDTAKHLVSRFGRFLLSDDLSSRFAGIPFQYVAIRFDFAEEGAIKITLAYLPEHPSKMAEKDSTNAVFCDGFLIPTRIPRDEAVTFLGARGFAENPLTASRKDMPIGTMTTVRVECVLLVTGQVGIGSVRGRATGEATALIDTEIWEADGNYLYLEPSKPVILTEQNSRKIDDLIKKDKAFKLNADVTYNDVWDIHYELLSKFTFIDFSVNSKYNAALEAVFVSGHRGLLI